MCCLAISSSTPCDLFELPEFSEIPDTLLNTFPADPDLNSNVCCLRLEMYLLTKKRGRERPTKQPSTRKACFNDSYIKVSKRKVDDLLNWISELIILQAQLTTTASSIQNTALNDVTEQLEMITGRLRDTSLEIGLVPVETL